MTPASRQAVLTTGREDLLAGNIVTCTSDKAGCGPTVLRYCDRSLNGRVRYPYVPQSLGSSNL